MLIIYFSFQFINFLLEMPAALSDQEQDAVKLACLPIGAIEVTLNPDEIVVQVSCGLHHSGGCDFLLSCRCNDNIIIYNAIC